MKVIDEDLIVLDADVSTDKESIDLAGSIFLKKGYVLEGYAEAAKSREVSFPTGLDTGNIAIAIPHTDPAFATHTAVGCIIPKHPVKFTAMGTVDTILNCEIIFPIIVNKEKDQVRMLKELMYIFNSSEALKKIRGATSTQEVLEVLDILNEKITENEEV